MKNKLHIKVADGCIGCLSVLLILFMAFGISWLATCGIVWLITLCFGWKFNWFVATGIWFIAMFVSGWFKTGK